MKCGSEHPFDPDQNFCCKVQYWKQNGSPLQLPTHFRAATAGGYTQRELMNDTIESSKHTGQELLRPSRN